MTEYQKNLSEPWFSLITLKLKTVEGRLNKGDFSVMKKGDFIVFTNNDFALERRIRVKITSLHKYRSFREYLINEDLGRCLPGMPNLEHGVGVYDKYFTAEDQAKYDIVAVRFRVVK